MTSTKEALPESKFEMTSLGNEFDPSIYPLKIKATQADTLLQLNIIMEETSLGFRKSQSLVRGIEGQLKGTELDLSKTYEVFYPLTPRTVTAVNQVIDNQRQLRADKRMAKKLTDWEDYFNNQTERDAKIAEKMETVDWLLNGIKDSTELSEAQKKEQREQIIRSSLKDMSDLAPEQILKSFLKPESYHPRKMNKTLVETALNRMDYSIKPKLTVRVLNNNTVNNVEEFEAAQAFLAEIVNTHEQEKRRLNEELERVILTQRKRIIELERTVEQLAKTPENTVIEGVFRAVEAEPYTQALHA